MNVFTQKLHKIPSGYLQKLCIPDLLLALCNGGHVNNSSAIQVISSSRQQNLVDNPKQIHINVEPCPDVERFIGECAICAHNKIPRALPFGEVNTVTHSKKAMDTHIHRLYC